LFGEEFFYLIITWLVGSIIGSTVVAIVTNKFIIPKIMKHKDVNDTIQVLKDIQEYLKDIREYLKQTVELQKKKKSP
jgi:hypothetical protein